MSEVGGGTTEGDAVGVVIGQLGQKLVERLGMADLVLGDRAGCDVLLEHRRDTGPFRVPEADDELVVGDAQDQLRQRVPGCEVQGTGCGGHSPASVAARAFAASSLCLMMYPPGFL